MEDFAGTVSLGNRGASWKEMDLKAKLKGDARAIELADLKAKLLGGSISGSVSASRGTDMRLTARFTGSGLNPARLRPDLDGDLNIDVKGNLLLPEKHPMEGSFTASLKNSTFRKKSLSADVDASFRDEIVRIKTLSIKGNGFAATAAGILQERLACEIRIDDAAKLLPQAAGSLFAKGWVRWRENEPAGALTARGKNMSYDDARLSSLSASMEMPDGYKGGLAVDIAGRGLSYGALRAKRLDLGVTGKTEDHKITLALAHDGNTLNMQAKGGYADGAWKGTIVSLSGTQTPSAGSTCQGRQRSLPRRNGFSFPPLFSKARRGSGSMPARTSPWSR